jgi:hypothetical protein
MAKLAKRQAPTAPQTPTTPKLIEPIADKFFNKTASGLVNFLMPFNQLNSDKGTHLKKIRDAFISSPENVAAKLVLNLREYPEGKSYRDYVDSLKEACKTRTVGLFDVVVVEASVVGELAECLLDMGLWDSTLNSNYMGMAVKNGMKDGRMGTYCENIK